MARPVMELTCPQCRGLVPVAMEDLGREGACPNCGHAMAFPESLEAAAAGADAGNGMAQVTCVACGLEQEVPPGTPSGKIPCSRCRTPLPAAKARPTGVVMMAGDDPKEFNRLLPHAATWPWGPITSLPGVLLVLPVALAVATLALWHVSELMVAAGSAMTGMGEDSFLATYGVYAQLALLLLFAGVAGYAASPLARLATLAVRSINPPLAEAKFKRGGLEDFSRLGAALAWGAVYLGPAFIAAYVSSTKNVEDANAVFGFDILFWLLLFAGLVLGPMAYVRSCLLASPLAPFQVKRVWADIKRAGAPYGSCVAMIAAIVLGYGLAGRYLFWGRALDSWGEYGEGDRNFLLTGLFLTLAYLAWTALPLAAARALGCLVQYAGGFLRAEATRPVTLKKNEDAPRKALAAAGLLLLLAFSFLLVRAHEGRSQDIQDRIDHEIAMDQKKQDERRAKRRAADEAAAAAIAAANAKTEEERLAALQRQKEAEDRMRADRIKSEVYQATFENAKAAILDHARKSRDRGHADVARAAKALDAKADALALLDLAREVKEQRNARFLGRPWTETLPYRAAVYARVSSAFGNGTKKERDDLMAARKTFKAAEAACKAWEAQAERLERRAHELAEKYLPLDPDADPEAILAGVAPVAEFAEYPALPAADADSLKFDVAAVEQPNYIRGGAFTRFLDREFLPLAKEMYWFAALGQTLDYLPGGYLEALQEYDRELEKLRKERPKAYGAGLRGLHVTPETAVFVRAAPGNDAKAQLMRIELPAGQLRPTSPVLDFDPATTHGFVAKSGYFAVNAKRVCAVSEDGETVKWTAGIPGTARAAMCAGDLLLVAYDAKVAAYHFDRDDRIVEKAITTEPLLSHAYFAMPPEEGRRLLVASSGLEHSAPDKAILTADGYYAVTRLLPVYDPVPVLDSARLLGPGFITTPTSAPFAAWLMFKHMGLEDDPRIPTTLRERRMIVACDERLAILRESPLHPDGGRLLAAGDWVLGGHVEANAMAKAFTAEAGDALDAGGDVPRPLKDALNAGLGTFGFNLSTHAFWQQSDYSINGFAGHADPSGAVVVFVAPPPPGGGRAVKVFAVETETGHKLWDKEIMVQFARMDGRGNVFFDSDNARNLRTGELVTGKAPEPPAPIQFDADLFWRGRASDWRTLAEDVGAEARKRGEVALRADWLLPEYYAPELSRPFRYTPDNPPFVGGVWLGGDSGAPETVVRVEQRKSNLSIAGRTTNEKGREERLNVKTDKIDSDGRFRFLMGSSRTSTMTGRLSDDGRELLAEANAKGSFLPLRRPRRDEAADAR